MRSRSSVRLAVALGVTLLAPIGGTAATLGAATPLVSRSNATIETERETASDLASFSYLHVEANEGDSSGGHVGIRFRDRVYHFQNRGGLLVLDRVEAGRFLHAYALVANRDVRASRVAVPAHEAERLRGAFDRRFHAQQRQLDVLASLDADVALLAQWQRAASAEVDPTGQEPLEIPALGYFGPLDDAVRDPSPVVVAVRERIEARYGANFLADRRGAGSARLRALARTDPAAWPAQPPDSVDDAPAFTPGWSRVYVDAASGLAALEVLAGGIGLRTDATIAPTSDRYRLSVDESRRLHEAAAALESRLVALADSPRSDWGRPFLIGLARLEAMHASLQQGRWLVVDAMPDDAARIPSRVVAGRRDLVREMAEAGHEQASRARRAWLADPHSDERAWTRIEDSMARVDELEQSLANGRDLRVSERVLVPLRPGPLSIALPRANVPAPIRRNLDRVRVRRDLYAAALTDLHGYALIRRNCVSELFRTLNDGLGGSVAASRRVLGGHVDGQRALRFVPFVSAAAVDAEYRVVERRTIPSYRRRTLERMRANENDVWVAFRESSTLTAQSYRRGRLDSFFVFFTDDRPALRPPLGAVNLVSSVGETTWGLALLPIDRGATLSSGLQGGLMSLPELVFLNIRKGSNDWVKPEIEPDPNR